MKLKARTKALHEGFQYAGSVITSSTVHPIYRNLKLDATAEGLYVSATDLEVGVKVMVQDVEVQEGGSLLLPEANVSAILGATADEEVLMETEGDWTHIRCADGDFRIISAGPEEFEDIQAPEGEQVVEIDPEVLRYMVRRTSFATAEERGRYALNGILFVVEEGGEVELVAADGARLSRVVKKVSNPGSLSVRCIVSKKGMERVAQLSTLTDVPITIQVTGSQFLAQNDRGCVSCQLVEGQFPDYKSIMPTEVKVRVEVETKKLLSAVRRAAFVTTVETNAEDFTFAEGTLTVRSESPEIGEAEIRLPIEYDAERLDISFNPEYLEDVLDVIERESVKMEFIDAGSPCVIKSGFDFTYLISPVVREEGALGAGRPGGDA